MMFEGHLGYITGSYLVAFFVIGGLIGHTLWQAHVNRSRLANLEAKDPTNRDSEVS